MSSAAEAKKGVAFGLSAYLLWGFLPVYFKLLGDVLPTEVVAQRILWSVVLLAGLIAVSRRGPQLLAALRNPRALKLLAASAVLIGINWLVYIWAIGARHVLETSLGYFLNPLVNVVMGVVLLKERLTRAQGVAVALAATGVAVLAAGAASGLWISLVLALSFATYGLIRKVAPVDSLEGLTIETVLLAPLSAAYLVWLSSTGELSFGTGRDVSLLLALGGLVTATPLLLFAAGARRLPYSTMGLLQYIAPTIQFLLAVLAFGEPLTTAHLICFSFIWAGLAVYALDGLRRAARPVSAVPRRA
ncbi:EamA family transporter RarD [Sphingomonas sp. ID1715]|uniref:EamA family transporter RarD n=1 Tax=Sphingomonas sp. ID1715 TaxID=1656898 RepID=UPI001487D320|nr:EamA family transporter RarD [Sphingomonas sp. ID1715]NNM76869.1 EamA family transporter RarD [Sphingomonas sp. ID1715]